MKGTLVSSPPTLGATSGQEGGGETRGDVPRWVLRHSSRAASMEPQGFPARACTDLGTCLAQCTRGSSVTSVRPPRPRFSTALCGTRPDSSLGCTSWLDRGVRLLCSRIGAFCPLRIRPPGPNTSAKYGRKWQPSPEIHVQAEETTSRNFQRT